MRLNPALLYLLPALVAAAQDQAPLKDQVQGWLNKAKSFIPTAIPAAQVAEKVSAATNKASSAGSRATGAATRKAVVTNVTRENADRILQLGDKERELLIYTTGGNRTCFGRCGRPDQAFEDSLPLFAADATSPELARLDCEKNDLLCNIWSTGPPVVWHLTIPAAAPAGQPRPSIPLHIVGLNVTTVTAQDIYKIHSEKTWAKENRYDGMFHPTDGALAQFGLNVVLGYIIWALASVPSWAMMIVISFVSRSFMSRRMGAPQPPRPRQQ